MGQFEGYVNPTSRPMSTVYATYLSEVSNVNVAVPMSLNVTIKTVGNLEHGPKIRCVSSRRAACTIQSEARDQAIAKVWVGRPRKEGLSCWLAGTRLPPGHCELCAERRRRGSQGLSEYAMIHEIPVNFRHPPHPGQHYNITQGGQLPQTLVRHQRASPSRAGWIVHAHTRNQTKGSSPVRSPRSNVPRTSHVDQALPDQAKRT